MGTAGQREAAEALQLAVESNPRNPVPYAWLAAALALSGDMDGAHPATEGYRSFVRVCRSRRPPNVPPSRSIGGSGLPEAEAAPGRGAPAGGRDRSVTAAEPGLSLDQPRIQRMDYARNAVTTGLAPAFEEAGPKMTPAETDDKPQPIKRVLVVDDDPAMQRMVSDYLEAHGCASVAANKFEMSRHLGAGSFNIVLLERVSGRKTGSICCGTCEDDPIFP